MSHEESENTTVSGNDLTYHLEHPKKGDVWKSSNTTSEFIIVKSVDG